jgi:hypothetical protein
MPRGEPGVTDQGVSLSGEARLAAPGAVAAPCRVTLLEDRFELAIAGSPPMAVAYRDIETLAVQAGSVLLVLGSGGDAVRVILERFGERLGLVVGELRTRRARQKLGDALVQLPGDDGLELVEYRIGDEHGVGQLAIGPWGAELLPLDERRPWRRIRRAEVAEASADPATGTVRVTLGERLEGGAHPLSGPLELLGLGAASQRLAEAFTGLRAAALRDSATLVFGLVPDAGPAVRQRLTMTLVDGRPASREELGDAADLLDRAVLTEPVFAASLAALLERAGPGAPRWFALAPERPGAEDRRAWYLVGLPGNLLALELVSAGAHATYLFRIAPRSTYGGADAAALGAVTDLAARAVSAALIDARFLREPMALPAEQLATARYRRYRLALSALPTLAAARDRFVARIVHDDPSRWASALDSLVGWHASTRDDAAVWPGRGAEESAVLAAGGSEAPLEASDSSAAT